MPWEGLFEEESQRRYNVCCAASGRVTARWCCVQEEVLSGKAKAQANVEELERLIPLLKEVRRACAALVINAISLTYLQPNRSVCSGPRGSGCRRWLQLRRLQMSMLAVVRSILLTYGSPALFPEWSEFKSEPSCRRWRRTRRPQRSAQPARPLRARAKTPMRRWRPKRPN